MSALGAFTQDNMSKLNMEQNTKDGEDSDHQLSSENESKKKKISKCNPCCCCRGEDSDDELRASAKAAFKAVQEERVSSPNTEDRASQTESIEMVTQGTAPNSPVSSSAESSYSPPFKHFKTPSFWPKDNKDDDDDDSDGLEFINADFRPPTSKLDLVGNDKRELELLERKRSGKDLVDDEDSLVETLQLTKPDKVKISNDSSEENQEQSVSQGEVVSSDPKVAACFGCQKFSSFSWPLKKI